MIKVGVNLPNISSHHLTLVVVVLLAAVLVADVLVVLAEVAVNI